MPVICPTCQWRLVAAEPTATLLAAQTMPFNLRSGATPLNLFRVQRATGGSSSVSPISCTECATIFHGALGSFGRLRDQRKLVVGEIIVGLALFLLALSHDTFTMPTFESSASMMKEYRIMKPGFWSGESAIAAKAPKFA